MRPHPLAARPFWRAAGVAVVAGLSSLPGCDTDTQVSVPPAWPRADVQLLTDDTGITHVFASSDEDAFHGAGYAMARDRLFQMEIARRRALGRLAELFGARFVKDDIGARAFDFERLGRADLARVQTEAPGEARLVEAWAAGVNARVDEIRAGRAPRPYGLEADQLDLVPEPFTAEHAFSIGKLLAFGLSSSIDSELLATALVRLAPDYVAKVPLSLPAYDTFSMVRNERQLARSPAALPLARRLESPLRRETIDAMLRTVRWQGSLLFDERSFSNNWVVSGSLTASGRPILAGDPHQPTTSPQRLWPVHMSSTGGGGTLDVMGFSFAGTPAVQLGHNARVAWTATTNQADVMDLWDIRTNDDRSVAHLGDGDHPIVSRKASIRVRREGSRETDTVDVVLEAVPGYGILLPDDVLPLPRALLADGDAILFRWTGFEPTRELLGFVGLDRARSTLEAERAIDLIDVGAQNFIAADAEHVTYHVHARIPDRGAPGSRPMPWRILPGSDARTFWTGSELSAASLPHERDPARGFLSTANNDPWGFTADGDVENDPFYYSAFYSSGFRAARIDQLLRTHAAAGRVTPDAMREMQNDTHSILADEMVPRLEVALRAIASDATLASYRDRGDLRGLATSLVAWDRRMSRARGEPLVFHALAWFAARRALVPALPDVLFDAIATRSPPYLLGVLRNVLADRFEGAPALVPAGNKNGLLLAALSDTSDWLRARFGHADPARLRWGDVNVCTWTNPFGRDLVPSPVGVDGGSDTIKVNEAPFFESSKNPRALFESKDVSLYRMVASFDETGRVVSWLSFARGAREDPRAPFFADREADWLEGRHTRVAFTRTEVEARAVERLTLRAAARD